MIFFLIMIFDGALRTMELYILKLLKRKIIKTNIDKIHITISSRDMYLR